MFYAKVLIFNELLKSDVKNAVPYRLYRGAENTSKIDTFTINIPTTLVLDLLYSHYQTN